jgi:hypothetical protein
MKASNTDPEDSVGASVAWAGQQLMVGACGDDICATREKGDQFDDRCFGIGAGERCGAMAASVCASATPILRVSRRLPQTANPRRRGARRRDGLRSPLHCSATVAFSSVHAVFEIGREGREVPAMRRR